MRQLYRALLVASAVLAAPAPAAADPAGYSIVGASHARVNYKYLTMEEVVKKLRPDVAARLPADGRLVVLNVLFRAAGDADKMAKLTPADLQLQWGADGPGGTLATAPILGAHISKDFWAMGSSGFYTSMRPDKYELFAIVPKDARTLDLAQRQPDGTFKVVKARIAVAAR